MINFEVYEKKFKQGNPEVMGFHEIIANHYKEKLNIHELLKSLGPDVYSDTGQDEKDFKCLAFSIGASGESLAKEKHELYK